MIERALRRLVGAVTRRPLLVLGLTAVLALGGAGLALRLQPSAATETLVNRGSQSFKDTERFKRDFGGEAILVLVHGDLSRTVLTSDLNRVLRLEGCLGGNVPDNKKGLGSLPPVCRKIAELKPAKVVYGPATFINTAVGQIQDQLAKKQQTAATQAQQAAEAARKLSKRRGDPPREQQRLAKRRRRRGPGAVHQRNAPARAQVRAQRLPRINDPPSCPRSCSTGPRGAGRAQVAVRLPVPSKNAALIQIRLRPDLTEAEQARAIDLIREATGREGLQAPEGARYIVTGVPVVAEGLADAVQRSIFILLGAALVLMAGTLALVFRSGLRLLPLGLALAAAAMTFGALSLAGGEPHDGLDRGAARADRPGGGLRDPVPGPLRRGRGARRPRACGGGRGRGGPTIITAGLATATGFLVLLLSPVPMVRGFGLLLVLGIVLALGCALCAGFAALVRFRGGARRERARAAALARCASPARDARASGSRTAPGARSAWRSRARGACSRSGWPWPWSAWRSTRRARWSRTCASSCLRTFRRCGT